MAKPLSEDLRVQIIDAVEGGMSRRAAAERFGVSPASAVRFMGAWRETGLRQAKALGDDRRSHRIEAHHERILRAIEAKPDLTLVEIAAMLKAETGERFSASSVWRFLDRHAVSFKKKAAHAAEHDRPDVAAARAAWRDAQPGLDPDKLVFIGLAAYLWSAVPRSTLVPAQAHEAWRSA